MSIAVAILGATGYSGAELVRLIAGHPHFEITRLGAHSQAGKAVAEALPGFADPVCAMQLAAADAPLPKAVELVFTALPHGAAATSVKQALDDGKKVVDLSADFRHRTPAAYAAAYGINHPHPELLSQAVYGLSELTRHAVANARLVANPGCYPTSALLPLAPLLSAGVIHAESIIVDSKSGASGAGRGVNKDLLYCELNESVKAYGLPRHRHVWEMEEQAQEFGGSPVHIRFAPHILPMTRGMLTTLHLSGDATGTWHAILLSAYENEPFVRILPDGQLPSSAGVRGSNRCDIGISVLSDHEAVVVSCIDNLLKGAAGQAVQNANLMSGLDEIAGLSAHAVWP
jgi:N-acetyl-gamma-glutamyl-phosphate reductase